MSQDSSDEHLDFIAALLDDIFRIPGTNLRFGLDAIVGLGSRDWGCYGGYGVLLNCIPFLASARAGDHSGAHDG